MIKNIIAGILSFISFAAWGEECRRIMESPPRGLTCFYCMHANAPGKADPIVDVLLKSCLSDVALSFVTDGSFGYDETVITSAINKVSEHGQTLWLHLYVYNGPAQRRWKARVFPSFAAMDPVLFRSQIKTSKSLQKKFVKEVRKLYPIIKLAAEKKLHVSLAPGLEDNLDNKAFAKAVELIKQSLPRNLLPKLVRSNCGDCAPGNQSALPKGVSQEVHTARSHVTAKNGIVTNDGDFVRFSHDTPYSIVSDKTIDALIPVMKKAGPMKSVFHLWIPKFQDSLSDNLPRSPAIRTYRKPNPEEEKILIDFLREGLE